MGCFVSAVVDFVSYFELEKKASDFEWQLLLGSWCY